jgi:hypothetical protein
MSDIAAEDCLLALPIERLLLEETGSQTGKNKGF